MARIQSHFSLPDGSQEMHDDAALESAYIAHATITNGGNEILIVAYDDGSFDFEVNRQGTRVIDQSYAFGAGDTYNG